MSTTMRTVLLAALLLLAACGSVPTGGQASEAASASAGAAAATTAASETASAAASEASSAAPGTTGSAAMSARIATFTRSGGFAGRTQTLVVEADGAIALLNGDANGALIGTGTAAPADLDALKAELASAEWQALAGKFGQQVPDGFAYTVDAGGKQVETYDGATNPAVLERVLGALGTLWQAAEGGASAPAQ